MFTFLFDPETPSLSSPTLYSSIHHQLGPLQKPLLSSTSPTTASARISLSDPSDPNNRSTRSQILHDFIYDPSNLAIRSSIPNIPALGTPSSHPQNPHRSPPPSQSKPGTAWSRIESLAIHHRLLTTYIETRSRPLELERTCKTSRGWWIVWVRIPQTQGPNPDSGPSTPAAPLSTASSSAALSSIDVNTTAPVQPQEAFLVRKASDYVSPGHGRVSSGARFFRDLGGASSKFGSGRADTTPSKLVEGIGMDARRYIEGLLRFNR